MGPYRVILYECSYLDPVGLVQEFDLMNYLSVSVNLRATEKSAYPPTLSAQTERFDNGWRIIGTVSRRVNSARLLALYDMAAERLGGKQQKGKSEHLRLIGFFCCCANFKYHSYWSYDRVWCNGGSLRPVCPDLRAAGLLS
jgi:hypothetical protein